MDALTLSCADIRGLVHAIAEQLREAAVETGDRILVMIPNSAENIVGVFTVIATGAIANSFNIYLDVQSVIRMRDTQTQTGLTRISHQAA